MEKQKAEFHFKKDYTDAKGNPQAVTVILEVNYKTGNFSVNPFFSNKNGFCSGNRQTTGRCGKLYCTP